MRKLVTLAVCAFAFTAGAADAHLITKPKNDSREAIHASQKKNLAHARYVCANGARKHQRWACKAVKWLEREARETAPPIVYSPRAAICAVFGPHCSAALSVAHCETGGTFSVYAQNGQYLGLFQMGSYARARYGHSWTAIGQARAAYRYFLDAGWSPWQCMPGGGLRW